MHVHSRPHVAIAEARVVKPETPDIGLLEAVVAPQVLRAMHAISAEYRRLGIRHALVGGLAVGAQGWPRATKYVDFIVDEGAFERRPGGLVLLRVPFEVDEVPVDSLAPASDEEFLARARDAAVESRGIPVLGIEALVYMKLKAGRMRDQVDVVELLKAGADEAACRRWLEAHAPAMLPRFDPLAERAHAESG
jgi:hypothetical protein